MARRNPVVPFSRDYRRPPRWSMGLPPRRPPGRLTRVLRRLFNPLVYLRLVILVGCFGLILLPVGTDLATAAMKTVTSPRGDCRVLSVIDGDTLTLVCAGLGRVKARLLGLDAPEKYDPGCAGELVAAEQATWALRRFILQAEVLQLTQDGTDRYGRVLVRLMLDGQDVARLMIRAGHARAYGGGLRGSWC